MKRSILLTVLLVLCAGLVSAKVKLPAIFSSGMVLQREMNVPVWGWATPGEKVVITASWDAQASAVADKDGNWKTTLKTPKAGGPFKVIVKGENSITLDNVMSGEVWLCSGQSNMEMSVRGVTDADKEIAAANYPNIRLFNVRKVSSQKKLNNCTASWQPCSPRSVRNFSAAGYFFGRDVYKELKDVPVGLIEASWGGTCIEAWTPWEVQKDDTFAIKRKESLDKKSAVYNEAAAKEEFKKAMAEWNRKNELWKRTKRQGRAPRRPKLKKEPKLSQNYPGNLYRGMIAPIEGYAIRGAIWYQGEANSHSIDDAVHYRKQLETMITSWRQIWGQGNFHFYYVQLPNFMKPWQNPVEEKEKWPYTRESFLKASKEIPDTGMAITIDAGEERNIHPKNKQAVGNRLARLALNDVYKRSNIVRSGPVVKSVSEHRGKVTVTFDNGGAPLAVDGKTIEGFAIKDEDGKIFKAEAKIIAPDKVELTCPGADDPVMVYYGWANNPVGINLINKAGLPASPFRAETVEVPSFFNLWGIL